MTASKKLKQLTFSLLIGVGFLLTVLGTGFEAISAYLRGDLIHGRVERLDIKQYRASRPTSSNGLVERHNLVIQYVVDDEEYTTTVNSHFYTAMNIIEEGDSILLSYQKATPEKSYVLSYALYNVFSSIMWPFALLILIVIPPQWYVQYRRIKKARENIA
jgi:hypothetical protein